MIRLLVTYGLAFATVGGLTAVANSEDRGAWFKSLRQPGTGMSCCDIADCHRTVADWRERPVVGNRRRGMDADTAGEGAEEALARR